MWKYLTIVTKPSYMRSWLQSLFPDWSDRDRQRMERPAEWMHLRLDERYAVKPVKVGTDLRGNDIIEYRAKFALLERKYLYRVALDTSNPDASAALEGIRKAFGRNLREELTRLQTELEFTDFFADPRNQMPHWTDEE